MLLPTGGAAPVAQVFAFGSCWNRGTRGIGRIELLPPFAQVLAARYSFLFTSSLLILSLTLFLASSGIQALGGF